MSAMATRPDLKWNRIDEDELAEQFGSRAGDVSKRFETRTPDQFRFVVEEVLHRGAFDYRWSVYDDVTDQKVGTGKVMFPSMMDVGYSIEGWRSQYAELYGSADDGDSIAETPTQQRSYTVSDGNLICKCGDVLVKGADVFHPDDYAGEGGCFWNVEDNEGNCDHNSTVTKADIIFPKPAAPDTPLPCAGDYPPYDCDCPDCMAYDEQVDQAVSRHIEELDQAEADSAAQAIAMMEGEFPPAYDNGPNFLGADY